MLGTGSGAGPASVRKGPTVPGTPVVFVHGLWLHASSWDPWLELFGRAGYDPVAARWPGEHETVAGTRADPEAVADHGTADIAEHLAGIIDALPSPPVLIGHRFGGMLVERLLSTGHGRAGIGIDAARVRGVRPGSALGATVPVSGDPADIHRAVPLTADQFHHVLGTAIGRDESDRLHGRWAVPAPGRALSEAAGASSPAAVGTRNGDRGPLLLITSGRDHAIPGAAAHHRRSTVGTDLVEFPDRGHSLVVDAGWRDVAESCLTWLDAYEV